MGTMWVIGTLAIASVLFGHPLASVAVAFSFFLIAALLANDWAEKRRTRVVVAVRDRQRQTDRAFDGSNRGQQRHELSTARRRPLVRWQFVLVAAIVSLVTVSARQKSPASANAPISGEDTHPESSLSSKYTRFSDIVPPQSATSADSAPAAAFDPNGIALWRTESTEEKLIPVLFFAAKDSTPQSWLDVDASGAPGGHESIADTAVGWRPMLWRQIGQR